MFIYELYFAEKTALPDQKCKQNLLRKKSVARQKHAVKEEFAIKK